MGNRHPVQPDVPDLTPRVRPPARRKTVRQVAEVPEGAPVSEAEDLVVGASAETDEADRADSEPAIPRKIRNAIVALFVGELLLFAGLLWLGGRSAATSAVPAPRAATTERPPSWANLFTHGGIDETKWQAVAIEGDLIVPDTSMLAGLKEYMACLSIKRGAAYVQCGIGVVPSLGADRPSLFYVTGGKVIFAASGTETPDHASDAGPPGSAHKIRISLRPDGRAEILLDGRSVCSEKTFCRVAYGPGLAGLIVKTSASSGSIRTSVRGLRYRNFAQNSWTNVSGEHTVVTPGFAIGSDGPGSFTFSGTM